MPVNGRAVDHVLSLDEEKQHKDDNSKRATTTTLTGYRQSNYRNVYDKEDEFLKKLGQMSGLTAADVLQLQCDYYFKDDDIREQKANYSLVSGDEESQFENEGDDSEASGIRTKRRKKTNVYEYSSGNPYTYEERVWFEQLPDGISLSDVYDEYTRKFGPGRTKGAVKKFMHKCKTNSRRPTAAQADAPLESTEDVAPALVNLSETKQVSSEAVQTKETSFVDNLKHLCDMSDFVFIRKGLLDKANE
jgi:hypothetical protein